MEIKVSIVIPNYNGRQLLEKNLPKVIAACQNCELILVDDASTDDSISFLNSFKKQFDNLRVIRKNKNEGFSSTINLGVKNAKGKLVVLLNSDVVPHKDFLKFALPHFEDADVFAVGLHDLSHEKDASTISRGRGVGKFIRGYLMHRPGKIITAESLWASCGSGVFRKDIWEQIGGLDTIYNPAYGEDWDLGYRAWKMGYKIIFEKEAIVDHFHEQGALRKRYTSFYRRAITFRNQNIFVLKNITDKKFLLEYLLFLPYHLVYKAIRRLDFAFWYGFLLFLVKIPGIKMPRFIKTDKEIIDKFLPEFEIKNEEIF